MVSVQELIDLGVEHNLAPSSYVTMWHEYAEWQMHTLRGLGMEPRHRLLDVGCGALRLGSVAIPYLDPGHYCGIDPSEELVRMGEDLLARMGVERGQRVLIDSTFDFGRFGQQFDFAIAQSVFTHLSMRQIERCVEELSRVMVPGGRFVFTYNLMAGQRRLGFLMAGVAPTMMPGLQDAEIFAGLAERQGIGYSSLESDHSTQQCGLYTF